ncbi:uncharacterized protein LOC116950830 [Petromyzon marinus]|uniref:uncharacterized protein LOC116950830 n=1 Tax=Petromyzon marinus TaxID=7757 RepID=UPI003F7097AB
MDQALTCEIARGFGKLPGGTASVQLLVRRNLGPPPALDVYYLMDASASMLPHFRAAKDLGSLLARVLGDAVPGTGPHRADHVLHLGFGAFADKPTRSHQGNVENVYLRLTATNGHEHYSCLFAHGDTVTLLVSAILFPLTANTGDDYLNRSWASPRSTQPQCVKTAPLGREKGVGCGIGHPPSRVAVPSLHKCYSLSAIAPNNLLQAIRRWGGGDLHLCVRTRRVVGLACLPPFSFWHALPLGGVAVADAETVPPVPEFILRVQGQRISANLDGPEGGLDAILQAAVCKEQLGWRPGALHVLLVASDADLHLPLDARLAGVVRPHDGRCHLSGRSVYTRAADMVLTGGGQGRNVG